MMSMERFPVGLKIDVTFPNFQTQPGGQFLQMTGTIAVASPAGVFDDRPQRNKELALDAMTPLFQRHDALAVERLYETKSKD